MKIAVLSSITLSSMILVVLLIQGCKKPADSADNGSAPTNDASASTPQLGNVPPDTNTSTTAALPNPAPASNATPVVSAPPVVTPPPMATPPPPPVAEMQEYTIVKGDLIATIAKNNHVSSKAILDANPGVDPKKLKVGQKIKIPEAASASPGVSAPTSAPAIADTGASSGAVTYKVKSGDTLTTIAKKNHVTIKAIQSANNLGSSTSIKVGQVLKIPGAAAPAPAPEAAPVPAPAPAPAPVAAPMSNSTTVPLH